MKKRRLGRSGLVVTELCFGTMTMGSNNEERESLELLDRAYDAGIDFFDTAEMYPVPPDPKWVFRTEQIVGKWLKSKPRDSVILATKIAGPAHGWFIPPIRNGKSALDRHQIRQAIQGSLKRLGTDYVDLYQTHWQDHDYGYEETLAALSELVDEGRVRVLGSSNENAWGAMKALAIAEQHSLCRYETIQNNFSILNRRFEDELANICRREGMSCLPFSPLGGGVCTGKYNMDPAPVRARFTEYAQQGGPRQKAMARRFLNENTRATVEELKPLAQQYGLSLPVMCLAWSKQHDFVASTIFGATTLKQLEENLGAADVLLPSELLTAIDEVTSRHLYPMG